MIELELGVKEIKRIHYVDLLVARYYRMSLYNFCEKYKYDELFLEIIKQATSDYGYDRMGQILIALPENLEDRYYEVETKFSYGTDTRGVVERVISLGVNWVVEDVIVHKSSSVFILTGCDNTRNLLVNPITNTPDIRYVGVGESFYVEVCSDFTQFMKRVNRYDIRKLKYTKLEDLYYIDGIKTILLFVDVVNKSFYRLPFKPQPYTQHNKHSANTVTFDFDDNAEFKDLMVLFNSCKKRQLNPSLYSNFNDMSEKSDRVEKSKKLRDELEDENYWYSLFKTEPEYIRCREVSCEEIEGILPDPYLLEAYGYDFEMDMEDGSYDEENLERLGIMLDSQIKPDYETPDYILEGLGVENEEELATRYSDVSSEGKIDKIGGNSGNSGISEIAKNSETSVKIQDNIDSKLKENFAQISEIEALKDNWNGNDAAAFTPKIIQRTKRLVSSLVVQPSIFPTERGSIQLEYENKDKDYLEFEIFENGYLKMFIYTKAGQTETKEIPESSINEIVRKFYDGVIDKNIEILDNDKNLEDKNATKIKNKNFNFSDLDYPFMDGLPF